MLHAVVKQAGKGICLAHHVDRVVIVLSMVMGLVGFSGCEVYL